MAAEETWLGASENLANIALGGSQVDTVMLGNLLVWRNNVPPFLNLLVNGTLVDTNGTPLLPEDQDDPTTAVLTTFAYTDTITIGVSGVIDEDMHYPIVINLYDADFDRDDTLVTIAPQVIVTGPGGSGTLRIPRGGQPPAAGTFPAVAPPADAADFIFTNRLYSLVATDAEEGMSIFYFRLTVNDVADRTTTSAWRNNGALVSPGAGSPQTTGPTFIADTTTTAVCTQQFITQQDVDRTVEQDFNQQPEIRDCEVQIVGVQDSPPVTCAGAGVALTRNRQINVGGARNVDVNSGAARTVNNTDYDATTTDRVGTPIVGAAVLGACAVPAGTILPGCGAMPLMCTGNVGLQDSTISDTPTTETIDCTGAVINTVNGTPVARPTTQVACAVTYPNPAMVASTTPTAPSCTPTSAGNNVEFMGGCDGTANMVFVWFQGCAACMPGVAGAPGVVVSDTTTVNGGLSPSTTTFACGRDSTEAAGNGAGTSTC